MHGVAYAAENLDVVDMRLVPDHELEHRVDLIRVLVFVAFDQHGARVLLDHHKRSAEDGGRFVTGGGEDKKDRPLDRGARGHADERTIGHQRGVERDGAIAIGRHDFAEMRSYERVATRERVMHRADRETFFKPREIGKFGDECSIDEDDTARVHGGEQLAGILSLRAGRCTGRAGEWFCVVHQRAQIRVFPFLDAPVR